MDFISQSDFAGLSNKPIQDKSGASGGMGIYQSNPNKQFDLFNDEDEDIDDPVSGGIPASQFFEAKAKQANSKPTEVAKP